MAAKTARLRQLRLAKEAAERDKESSAGDNVPEGAIVIDRVFVDPPERPEAPLLVAEEPAGKDVFGGTEKRKWLIDYPNLGIA
jgi:hypothetical protein